MASELNRIYGIFTPQDLAARAVASADLHGNTPGKLPPVSISLALTNDQPMLGGVLESRIQGVYRKSYYFRAFNDPVYDRVPDMHQLDLSFRFTPDNQNWYGELLVLNVTDSTSVNSHVADDFGVGGIANLYVRPRQVIGRIGYRF